MLVESQEQEITFQSENSQLWGKLYDSVSQYTQKSKLVTRWSTHMFILWGKSNSGIPQGR